MLHAAVYQLSELWMQKYRRYHLSPGVVYNIMILRCEADRHRSRDQMCVGSAVYQLYYFCVKYTVMRLLRQPLTCVNIAKISDPRVGI